MTRLKKLALVLAGYVLAFVASNVAVANFNRRFTPADNDAMGGMIAGGEMMLAIAVFGAVSIVPTGLAIWFMRGSPKFWARWTRR